MGYFSDGSISRWEEFWFNVGMKKDDIIYSIKDLSRWTRLIIGWSMQVAGILICLGGCWMLKGNI